MPGSGKLTMHAYSEENIFLLVVRGTDVGILETAETKLFTSLFSTKPKGQSSSLSELSVLLKL
jgi:hypothetical protein